VVSHSNPSPPRQSTAHNPANLASHQHGIWCSGKHSWFSRSTSRAPGVRFPQSRFFFLMFRSLSPVLLSLGAEGLEMPMVELSHTAEACQDLTLPVRPRKRRHLTRSGLPLGGRHRGQPIPLSLTDRPSPSRTTKTHMHSHKPCFKNQYVPVGRPQTGLYCMVLNLPSLRHHDPLY
jgi:hypothetical protein